MWSGNRRLTVAVFAFPAFAFLAALVAVAAGATSATVAYLTISYGSIAEEVNTYGSINYCGRGGGGLNMKVSRLFVCIHHIFTKYSKSCYRRRWKDEWAEILTAMSTAAALEVAAWT